jgi:hypothetical protein
MARQTLGFVDQHVEKVVVGLCALVFVGCAVYSFGGFRFGVEGRSPGALAAQAREQATRLAEAVRNALPKTDSAAGKETIENTVKELSKWFGPTAEGLVKIARIEQEPGRTQPFPPSSATDAVKPEDRHNLARLVPPSLPVVTGGRSTFEIPKRLELGEVVESGPHQQLTTSERCWVSVAAQVDLAAQEVNFRSEKYPENSYLTIVKVCLQRKDETEPWRDWQDVDTYLPYLPPKLPQVGESSEEIRQLLDEGNKYVARTRLPARKSGESVEPPPVPYLDEPPVVNPNEPPKERQDRAAKLARKWLDQAKKAMQEKGTSKKADLDVALMLVRAAKAVGPPPDLAKKAGDLLETIVKGLPDRRIEAMQEPPPPEKLMPIMASDLDAVPGHTYVYRMRYEVLNRYAGIPGELTNPADAERLTVVSDWSLSSRRPVTIESDVDFCMIQAKDKAGNVTTEAKDKAGNVTTEVEDKPVATVVVYKKGTGGTWKSKEFKIKVGEEIGRNDKLVKKTDFSTNAVCVDIDFNRVVGGKKDVALVYLDTGSGALRERLLSLDRKRDSELRKKVSKP